MAIILDTGESLRFDLSGVPSTPWSYSISYDQRGHKDGGEKSAVGTISVGTPVEILAAPDGFAIRQQSISEISVVNLGDAALTLQIQKYDGATATVVEQVVVQIGGTFAYRPDTIASAEKVQEISASFSAADIVALGASLTGELSLGTLPAGAIPIGVSLYNGGTVAATLATLTGTIGTTAGSFVDLLDNSGVDVHAADAGVAQAVIEPFPRLTAATEILLQLTGNANLSTLTGLDDGIEVRVKYLLEA